ncbi:MAG TPA: ATP-dependent helicase [Candidatus Limnocylindria bacterium]|nr:ATP-dependent helicase [Candidatus Limnocylindria bacterium]
MVAVAVAPELQSLLGGLDAGQRAAAELPDGPALVIAPAGSGKTTTLIARLGVLLARGVAPERICVLTFNREAAAELAGRILARLTPIVPAAGQIEVRTLHALARQVLLDAGDRPQLVADRLPLLRAARRRALARSRPDAPPPPDAESLDPILSAWKIERRAPPPEASAVLEAYAELLAARGLRDFDDLVVDAVTTLSDNAPLRLRWQARFTHLAVDEFQDVDAAQLAMIGLLADPQRNLTVVGDDDQTIYAWRLADVRRMLDFPVRYPDTRVVQLEVNYRCPAPVVAASRRLVSVNQERFAKRIRAADEGRSALRAGAIELTQEGRPGWAERLVGLLREATAAGEKACVLARTSAELEPVLVALASAGMRHATSIPALIEAAPVTALLEAAATLPAHARPFDALLGLRTGRGWRRGGTVDSLGDREHAALDALLGWAAGFATLDRFLASADLARRRLAELRDPGAPIELLTVHAAKGREWATVVVLGFEHDRFPNRRALLGATDPARAMEEERRLAYVALTRARRRLVLSLDPARPSPFLAEMGYRPTSGAATDR